MVSITQFKCTFAGSVVYFFMIIWKVWCNFCFVDYVRNLALVGKGAIRFLYTITFYCFCFLFRDYFFVMHIDNWFNICHAAITYFHIIFLIFYDIYGCLENVFELKEGKIYRIILWKTRVEPDDVTFAIFRRFTSVFIFITHIVLFH